jgi:hypothetical protein
MDPNVAIPLYLLFGILFMAGVYPIMEDLNKQGCSQAFYFLAAALLWPAIFAILLGVVLAKAALRK